MDEIIMSKKIQLPIDLDELCVAFENSSYELEYYLDRKTGEIIAISESFMTIDEEDPLKEKIEEDYGTRYVLIPTIPSWESYNDMEDFIKTLGDANLQEKLYIAIDGNGAFRRFKNVLLHYPTERERWFKFQNVKLMQRVLKWLADEGIEILLINSRDKMLSKVT
jgi:hypothetical protein